MKKFILGTFAVIAIAPAMGNQALAGGGPHEPSICPTKLVEGLNCASADGALRLVLVTNQNLNPACGAYNRIVSIGTEEEGGLLQGSNIQIHERDSRNLAPVAAGTRLAVNQNNGIVAPIGGEVRFTSAKSGIITLVYGPEAQAEGAAPQVVKEFTCR